MDNKKPFNAGLAYAEFKQRQLAYTVAAITAFLMSAYFVVGYFAGHLRIMEWDGSQWAQAIPSLGLVAVMTAYQYFLYSKGDTEGGKKATIIAVSVAVAFSLLSEIGQGMERDNIRMESKSQESPTYKAIVQAIGAGAGASYNPYSADLQAAEMKLAQCEERLARGKEKHCEGSKARVDAVNKMIAGADQSSQAKALALATTAKTMERDENNYHPLVKFIREVFGASGTAASFLLSLTLISFFEYAFHYLGGQFAASREYLMAHGYDVTRKLRQPPRKHDGSVTTYSNEANESAPVSSFNSNANSARQTVGEFAAKVEQGLKSSPEIIANEYARAQNARENVYTVAANKLDGIQTGLNQASELKNPTPVKTWRESLNAGEKIVSTGGLDEPVINTRPANQMSVEATVKQIQASVKASGANSPTAIQAAVFDAYAGMANPAPLNDVILERMAEKLASKATIPTTVPAAPFHQKSGATGIHNPVLGTAEEHYALSLPRTASGTATDYQKGGEAAVKQTAATTASGTATDYQKGSEAAVKQSIESLYKVWRAAVISGKITTAERPFQQLAREYTDLDGISARALKPVWDGFGERATREGYLVLNPEYQDGNRKLKYLKVA
ncbi:hypothetical protein [Thiothrix lacustris]|uniref:hypothetical protein n=1 Tax=Thiothrix lacustris TaxID=525917 RepID=UPI0004912775|nr:hypothetical protein [Thiothrix lacustris]